MINIAGLSIGIACSLLITIYIAHELSYDQFNLKKNRIYQLVLNLKIGGQESKISYNCAPIGPAMYKLFPEVENFTRVKIRNETTVKYNEQGFTENAFIEADSSFFDIFSVQLIKGDKKNLLNAPHSLVISQSTANKIFGEIDPLGKSIKIGTDSSLYTITGIMDNLPQTSHFDANMIGSFITDKSANDNDWTSNSFETYVLLRTNSDQKQVEDKIADLVKINVGAEIQKYRGGTFEDFISQGNKYTIGLQPLTAIHLNPAVQQSAKTPGDPKYLFIFGIIAILIIVLASINFMNLSTAQSSLRAKEVGLKKVSGSTREMLIWQFLSESIILVIISLVIGSVLVKFTLPFFNNLMQESFGFNFLMSSVMIPVLIILAIILGLFAGSYPAFYLSSFKPYDVLKGAIKNMSGNGKLRKILVVLQFTISILLIIGSTIIFHQIHFMINKDLGFNKEQLIVIRHAEGLGSGFKAFKESVVKIPGVIKVSGSSSIPGHSNNKNGFMVEGRREETFMLQTAWVDYDFFDTYGMKISSGRNFNQSYLTDKEACLVNERAIKLLSLESPFTTRFISPTDDPAKPDYLSIIGVVKDFHFESLHNQIGPFIFRFKKESTDRGYITIKLSSGVSETTIKEIEMIWREYSSNEPMQYFFLDKDLNLQYREEIQSARLSVLFTVLTIFIASLGLFGLTLFTLAQRIKEMAIRKAMGASAYNLFALISKEIILLVSISALIAWPIVYLIARSWLQNYYYRIDMPVLDFISGFLIALAIAICTISYSIIKTVMINPSESLK